MNTPLNGKTAKELLDEVVVSEKMLTVCSYCGKAKDLRGTWFSTGPSLKTFPVKLLSHGICRSCLEKHFSNKSWFKKP